MFTQTSRPPTREAETHLYRGAPDNTDREWTRCGVHRANESKKSGEWNSAATENAAEVTCPYCRCLMHPRGGAFSIKAFRRAILMGKQPSEDPR